MTVLDFPFEQAGEAVRKRKNPSPTNPQEQKLLRGIEQLPVRIPEKLVSEAIGRALIAGADEEALVLLGMGQEGFVFGDNRAAYKVSRDPEKWSFSTTADVLRALAKTAAAPFVVSLHRYFPKEEVLVVDRVEGRTGSWGSPVRKTYDFISNTLNSLDYSPPEYKENSFIQRDDGTWVMVDLGFVYPLRERAAAELKDTMRTLDKTVDFFSLASEITYVDNAGLLDAESAENYLKKIDTVFGGEKASHVADLLGRPDLRKFYLKKFLRDFRKNPARARRSGERKIEKYVEEYGDVWKDVAYERFTQAPFLTEGHFDLPMVKEAVRIASRAKESESLGRGHFGEAFIVETSKGPVVVKIAAERMLYQDQRPWTREEQIDNIMHEAGVANELEEMGYDFAPRSAYVELKDGTPAIVREYGEIVEPGELSGREFYELEKALFGLEQDTGWRIQDELLLLRRPDGSLFIGDVGIWDAPNVGREREWRLADSHLPSLVGNLGEHLFGQRFSSLGRMQQLKKGIIKEKDLEDAFSKYFQEELTKAVASRRALGIPSED